MKTTVKRLFAAAMAVVMLFAVAPFADVGFGSIFSTKASAMETVKYSFRYVVGYLYDYGSTDDFDDPYIWTDEDDDVYIWTEWNYWSEQDKLLGIYEIWYDYNVVLVNLHIRQNDSKYFARIELYSAYDYERYGNDEDYLLDYEEAYIDPTHYSKKSKPFRYDYSNEVIYKTVKSLNDLLQYETGLTLGNFGFTGLYIADEVPSETVMQPYLLDAANTPEGVKVKWTRVGSADGYCLYRKTGSGSWSKIATTGGTSYIDTNVTAGKTYAYTVRSYEDWSYIDEGIQYSDYNPVGLKIKRLKEPAVTLSNKTGGISVKWNQIAGADGYYVYRKYGDNDYKRIATVNGKTNVSYTDKAIADYSGTNYTYTVRAFSGSSKSSFTGVTIKRLSNPKVTLENGASGITVKWDKVKGAKGYYVYRKSGENDYTRIAAVGSGTVNYADTAVQNNGGTTYTYAVRAYAGSDKSSYTGVNIKRLVNPEVRAVNTASGVKVKWNQISGASGYYVYRKTVSGSYAKIATVNGRSTVEYKDAEVKSNNGTMYIYTVRAFSGSDKSGYTGIKFLRLTTNSITELTSGSAGKFTVKYSQNAKAGGYQIQYSKTSDFASKTSVTATSLSKTVSGLTSGKMYYVRVRSYKTVDGVKYYSGWATKKSVKVK